MTIAERLFPSRRARVLAQASSSRPIATDTFVVRVIREILLLAAIAVTPGNMVEAWAALFVFTSSVTFSDNGKARMREREGRGSGRRWGAFGAALVVALAGATSTNGCIPPRTNECRVQSDCGGSGICSLRGYCVRECEEHQDCPCGAFCAPGCGLCLRDDRGGAATCFARREGLTTDDVLGVCRDDLSRDAGADGAAETGAGEDPGGAEADGGALPVASACRRAAPVCEETPAAADGSVEDAEADALDASDASDASDAGSDAGEGGPGDGG